MGRRKVVEERIIDDDEDRRTEAAEEAEQNEGVSLFLLGDIAEKKIDRIRVVRKDPDEGYLGDLGPDATEEEIFSRWGGGTFRLEAKNQAGVLVKVRTMKVAGDPVFQSMLAEARWRRSNGLPPGVSTARGGGPGAEGLGLRDVLLMMEERDAKRKAEESEREARDRREREERESRERAMAAEREERRQKEENDREERRIKLAREDEERRNRQHQQDLERAKVDTERMLAAQTQMFQHTIAMMQAQQAKTVAENPVDMLTRGIDLALKLRPAGAEGGEQGEQSPLNILLGQAGPILNAIRGNAAQAAAEAGGEEDGTPAQGEVVERGDAIELRGTPARLVRALAAKMAANGEDPEQGFKKLAIGYLRQQQAPKNGQSAPAQPAPRARKAAKKAPPAKKAVARKPRKKLPPPTTTTPEAQA